MGRMGPTRLHRGSLEERLVRRWGVIDPTALPRALHATGRAGWSQPMRVASPMRCRGRSRTAATGWGRIRVRRWGRGATRLKDLVATDDGRGFGCGWESWPLAPFECLRTGFECLRARAELA